MPLSRSRRSAIDSDTVYCQAGSRSVKVRNCLRAVIAYDRARGGPGVWDRIETLANGTVQYYRQMNPNFPDPHQSEARIDTV